MAANRIPSIMRGSDQTILAALLSTFTPWSADELKIVDLTYGLGNMWRKSPYTVVKYDDNALLPDLDHVGDYRNILCRDCGWVPEANTHAFIWDPPHLSEAGAKSKMASRYGLRHPSVQGVQNVTGLFKETLSAVKPYLHNDGVMLVKICDMAHRNRFQWQQVALVNSAIEVGMTPCWMVIKDRTGQGVMTGHNWNTVKHGRQMHSYWIVLRPRRAC